MEKKIRQSVSQAIQEKIFPGCVVGIVRKNGERIILPFGNFTYDNGSPAVKEDTTFDVASVTKAIPTSSLALKLIDKGKLKLENKLIDFIPEFHNSDRDNILIRHLLTLTLDYDLRLSVYKDKTPEEILEVIFRTGFRSKPGTKFFYTNATSILLGLVVEKISGKSLDQLADEVFFKPLGMNRTTFWPMKTLNKSEVVPTENDGWRDGDLQGVVHDESAYTFMKSGKVVGSAGLFSTAPDLLNFLEMLLNQGELKEKRYFSKETIREMHTNQLANLGLYQGLGWELYQPRYMGTHCTKETFGKTGFTGCVVMCDIGKEVGVVMLSNATYPKRKPLDEHREAINAVRRDVADIIFSSRRFTIVD